MHVGTIDIYDRRSLTKISTVDASNTSHCEWSPDCKFILTATLSPQPRVDQGIKIWYLLGQLLYCTELSPCEFEGGEGFRGRGQINRVRGLIPAGERERDKNRK